MTYRDELEALRERNEALTGDVAAANERADRSEKDIAQVRDALDAREAELRKLRAAAEAPPAQRGSGGRVLAALLAAALGMGGWFLLSRRAPQAPAAHLGLTPQFDSSRWMPAIPVAGADGAEDFVGTVDYDGFKTQSLARFSGRTLAPIWETTIPLAQPGSRTDGIHVEVVGERVVATDFRRQVHVYDLADGKELHVGPLNHEARKICPLPKENAAFIQVGRGKEVRLDLSTFALTSRGGPPSCRKPEPECAEVHAPCRPGGAAPDGLRSFITIGEGAARVSIGAKSPGTTTPTIFAAGGRGWSAVIPLDPAEAGTFRMDKPKADVANGLAVVAYDHKGHRVFVSAFDVATGARRWDVEVPVDRRSPAARSVMATDTRVYVATDSGLAVLELETGKLVGTLKR